MMLEDKKHRKMRQLKLLIPWYGYSSKFALVKLFRIFISLKWTLSCRMIDFCKARKDVYRQMDDIFSLFLKEVISILCKLCISNDSSLV